MSTISASYTQNRHEDISLQFRSARAGGEAENPTSLADRRGEADDPLADRRVQDTVHFSSAAMNQFRESQNLKMEFSAILNGTDEEPQAEEESLMTSKGMDPAPLKKSQNAGEEAQGGAAATGNGDDSGQDDLTKQLEKAQKELTKAQQKLSQAMSEANGATSEEAKQSANAKVQAAQMEVQAAQAQVSQLTSQMGESVNTTV